MKPVIKKETITVKENFTIKYDFTKEELQSKAKQLAVACNDKAQLEDQKKETMSSFKYKIDGKDAEINSLSTQISNGYEMKTVKCDVKKIFKQGVKEYYYEGVLYETKKMTESDYQLEIKDEEEVEDDTTI